MTDLELAISDVCAAWPVLQPPNRMRAPFGRRVMCHMVADTLAEVAAAFKAMTNDG